MPPFREEMARQTLHRSCIIYPYHQLYRKWQNFIVLLALYTACVSPVMFGLMTEPQAHYLYIIDNFITLLFGFDILLKFFVAYEDHSSYLVVDNPKLIVLHYLTTWFVVDVICTILPKVLHATHVLNGILCLLQYLRHVGKIYAFLSRFEEDLRCNVVRVRCAKLVLILLSDLHFGGCMLFFSAANYDPKSTWTMEAMGQSLWTKYVVSSYRFRSTTFRNVPLTDLYTNELEVVFIILFIAVNRVIVIYVLVAVFQLICSIIMP